MNISPELTTLIALGSLVVSIISLIYARRVHKFEVEKYTTEQLSKDIIIDLKNTVIAELKDNYVLLSNFSIVNNTSSTEFVRYFSVWLYFKDGNKFLSNYMHVGLDPNGGTCGGNRSLEVINLMDSLGGIETAVVDINSKQRILFDINDMHIIEPAPFAYAWKALTVIPKGLMDELYRRYFQLSKVELIAILHPKQQKVGSSSRFLSVLSYNEEVDLDELSSLFPQFSFEHKGASINEQW
jgi:hypothetical protein